MLTRTFTLAAIAIAAVLSGPVFARDLDVPSRYSTIQDAVDAARRGDVIRIDNGTYNEHVVVRTNRIEIRGSGRTSVRSMLLDNVDRVTIESIDFDARNRRDRARIDLRASTDITIGNCSFEESMTGIAADGADQVRVRRCDFRKMLMPVNFQNTRRFNVTRCVFFVKARHFSYITAGSCSRGRFSQNEFHGTLLNVVESGNLGIDSNLFARAELALNNCSNIDVLDNTFNNRDFEEYFSYAIWTNSASDCTFDNNIIRRAGSLGGFLLHGSNNELTRNRIIRTGGRGLHVMSGGNRIVNNTGRRNAEWDLYDETGGRNTYARNSFGTSNL